MTERIPRSRRMWLVLAGGTIVLICAAWIYIGWILPHTELVELRALADVEGAEYTQEELLPESYRKWVEVNVPKASETVNDWSKMRLLTFSVRPSKNVDQEMWMLLGRQTGLEELSLDGRRVQDAQLQGLSRLSRLKSLELDDTKITGSGLPLFPRLKSLCIIRAPLNREGLQRIGQLPKLETLDLRGIVAPVDDDFEKLSSSPLRKLRILDQVGKARNRSGACAAIAKIATLEQLHMENADLAAVRALKASRKLTDLHIESVPIDIAEFQDFPALTHLAAGKALVPQESLRRLRPLVFLGLERTKFGDAELEALSHSPAAKTLTEMDLHDTLLTDEGLIKHLAAFPQLKTVFVRGSPVSAAGISRAATGSGLTVTADSSPSEFEFRN